MTIEIAERPLSIREGVESAQHLYNEIYARLRAQLDEARQPILDALHSEGIGTLRALARTASEAPLSDESTAMVRAYLRGPDPADEDAAETWMTLLPEVMLELSEREEARHARELRHRGEFEWREWFAREELSSRRLLGSWMELHGDVRQAYFAFVSREEGATTLRRARVRASRWGERTHQEVVCAA